MRKNETEATVAARRLTVHNGSNTTLTVDDKGSTLEPGRTGKVYEDNERAQRLLASGLLVDKTVRRDRRNNENGE